MWKPELIEVYENTIAMCKDFPTPASVKHSRILSTNNDYNRAGNIIIEPLDTVSALIKYQGNKTAILNMASSKRKGGGVLKGAVAQEECIFRCSNLFEIPDTFYPIQSDEYIYTEDASFVKNFYYQPIFPVTCDVVSMPAVNLNKEHVDNVGTNDTVSNYHGLMSYKICAMLNAASYYKCKNIILGAWGCGVFKNNPVIVAEIFKEELSVRRYMFDNVVFAIINDHNSVMNNYEIFKTILDKQK